ncbi:sodium/proline symporter PutP [Saccharibacillus alkalitolerans]|uniref:Sodium/proline symporter n=1 Tax=Saccharibacillus alkalitolerans TaxID=2705290 RepID=A0ABX0F7L8_9BACL|nr:sodium/proline symporter PutP [Saccharibacillus alkalitolerans]NGZ76375.1 sodium/proline symporter PutP [Saccharibacillus alkalitolerans]
MINTQILISLTVYLAGMLLIGWFAYKRTSGLSDYVLGGRSLGPAVTALSAGAADMSGWLLMGLPGAMFAQGLSAGWIAVGLTIGAYANWLYVAPRLRTYTEEAGDAMTIPSYLENRFGDGTRIVRLVSALVIIVFFTFYISSGMVSGGVLFQSSFGLDYRTGLWIVAGVTIAYTLFGGFLAVSWTDFVQGLIMFLALILVPVVTLIHTGGVGGTLSEIRAFDPTLLDPLKGASTLGIVSLLAWGLGYFGQPHIIVRFMAISSVNEIKKARRIGMCWMIFSVCGAMLTGLIGAAYFSRSGRNLADPETVFIELSRIMFHPLITGFLLAALLAAVMSTISSQLLVTSSSLTEDLYRILLRRGASERELTAVSRSAVLVVSIVALLLSYTKNDTILTLVAYAWAGFGASFGPVILLSLYWKRMNRWGALAGMAAGAITVIVWANIPVLKESLYEIVPGFAANLIAIVAVSLLTGGKKPELRKART